MRSSAVMRICCEILMTILVAGLIVWASAAPLVWILRDGLGPGMVESTGIDSVYRFLVLWGVPALVLGIPLLGLHLARRYFNREQPLNSPAPQ